MLVYTICIPINHA